MLGSKSGAIREAIMGRTLGKLVVSAVVVAASVAFFGGTATAATLTVG